MPIIRVEMFKGRTPEQKKAIARELVDGFIRGAGGGKPEAFDIIFTDVDKQDWAKGHEMMSEKYPDKT
ncbi:tautomerase family protein [Aestuariivirga sp.]|uniref:tautomerase family protein n=1 Tax=Aestuariivirga sp. TaxID=2650926 RepID=UPI003BADBCD4